MGNQSTPPSGMAPLNRVLSPALNLYTRNTPETLFQSAIDYFSSLPWTDTLLKVPRTITFIPQCFNPVSELHDQYLGKTLAGERGLRHMLCYFTPEDDSHLRDPDRPITKVSSLFALSDGLCGYNKVLHGGMTMSMVDESMGVINEINMALGKKGALFQATSVTATLEIKFLKPVSTDDAVCITAWVESWEGRKSRLKCVVRDQTGTDLAVCSSTWVSVKANM
jgi:acyl-coenzyme A thioesterase PaaI-like protein